MVHVRSTQDDRKSLLNMKVSTFRPRGVSLDHTTMLPGLYWEVAREGHACYQGILFIFRGQYRDQSEIRWIRGRRNKKSRNFQSARMLNTLLVKGIQPGTFPFQTCSRGIMSLVHLGMGRLASFLRNWDYIDRKVLGSQRGGRPNNGDRGSTAAILSAQHSRPQHKRSSAIAHVKRYARGRLARELVSRTA